MIKSINTMKVYELNGEVTKVGETPEITVESHWNRNENVILVVAGVRYTVAACDLDVALKNAQNVGRY